MSDLRFWLLRLVIGDYSVIMNADLNSERIKLKEDGIVALNVISADLRFEDAAGKELDVSNNTL